MEHALLIGDIVSVIAIVATLVVLALNIRDFWGTPTAEVFVYYGTASFLLGLIAVFMHLSLAHAIPVGGASRTLGWHLMFYLSMGMFMAGTTALLRLDKPNGPVRRFAEAVRRGFIPAAVGVVVFFAAMAADAWATRTFGGSLVDRIGIVHFIAFALCLGVVRAMRTLRTQLSSYLASIAGPLTKAVLIFGLVHLWELLSESWRVIGLPGELGEALELTLIACATVLVFAGLLRTRRKMS